MPRQYHEIVRSLAVSYTHLCGFPDRQENFGPAIAQFQRMFPHDRTVLTVPESPMFNAPEAASVTVPRLALVREAGRLYARTAAIPPELLT